MRNLKLGFSLAGCALIMATFIGINLLTSPGFPWSLFPVFAVLWWPISVYAYTKRSAMLMAVMGSSISIVFFAAVNIITSPGFPWSIYPLFALLWWPIGIYSAGKRSAMLMAVMGSCLTIAFFVTVNIITSPGFPWSIFPLYTVLWWPIGVYFAGKRSVLPFSVIGSLLTAVFLIIVNLVTSPGFPWSFFPVFVLVWWPLSVYCAKKRNMKLFSMTGSLLVIGFFFITDFITSPSIEWAFYAAFPILVWPALLMLKKYIKIETILLASGIIYTGYYILLNILVSPSYPWSIFVAYGILIAMVTSSFWYRNQGKWATLSSAAISVVFVAAVILFTGIKEIWIIKLVLIVLSSQVSVHLSLKRNYRALTVLVSFTVLLFVLFDNFKENPGHLWFLYVIFPVLWPLVMTLFPRQIKTFRFALFSAFTGILYYGILNLLLSPGHVWFIYPAFLFLWWPLAAYYARTGNSLFLAVSGSVLTISFLAGINLITSPNVVWFVFPAFAILWWPLSIMYIYKKRRVLADENPD